MTPVIEVKNLTKFYSGQGAVCRALYQVNLEIGAGEFVAVMGPSGSGKTTLLNIISTIDKPSQGQIIIDGRETGSLKEKELAMLRRDLVGFVFQEFNLLNNMTIRDNIALPLTLNNVKTEEILRKVRELTAVFGIDGQLDKYPYQLSGGQKQRAAVCRALVNKPKILFADEPTGALDSKAASELLTCFRNVGNRYGTTVVMVTHDAAAASYCDRVFFLRDGMIGGKLETNGNSEEFGSRLVSFSNTLFRLGTHYRSLSMTAILCAATFAAFSGSMALKYFADTNTAVEAPYNSISFINQDEATNQKIKALIQESPHHILAEHQAHFITGKVTYNNGHGEQTETCLVTSYSEAQKSLMVTRPGDYRTIIKNIEPRDNETVGILHSNLVFSGISHVGDVHVIQGKPYILKREVKIPFIGEIKDIGRYQTYIVTDRQYNELRKNAEEMTLYGINFTNPEDSIPLVERIASVMKNPAGNLNSYVGQYQYKYYLIGAFYFMGLVMAIVFVVSTFSAIYFKILSDAILDREQYGILMKIGMTEQEIAKSIYTQVGMAFIPPAALGTAHGIMAIKALESFIHYRFTASILVGVIVLILVMAGFYFLMSGKYQAMVVKGWGQS